MAIYSLHILCAQDLSPRAYLITPVNANVITSSWSFYNGTNNFDSAIPVYGATGSRSAQTAVRAGRGEASSERSLGRGSWKT
jgi:hypothetical protein